MLRVTGFVFRNAYLATRNPNLFFLPEVGFFLNLCTHHETYKK